MVILLFLFPLKMFIQNFPKIFGSATTEEQNLEKYIIHTPKNIHFGPSSIIYMGNIFCSIKILK